MFYNDCSDALTKFCFNDGVYKNKDDNIHKKNSYKQTNRGIKTMQYLIIKPNKFLSKFITKSLKHRMLNTAKLTF